MKLVDLAKVELKQGGYGVATAAALADGTVLSRIQGYRRLTRSRMMALDVEGAGRKLPVGDYHLSLKVDGEFNGLLFKDGEALLVNPGGTVRVGLPVLVEAAERLKSAGVGSALFAVELYVLRPDGKRPRVHDVSRVARKPESDEEVASLRLAVFDVLEVDGVQAGAVFARRGKDFLRAAATIN